MLKRMGIFLFAACLAVMLVSCGKAADPRDVLPKDFVPQVKEPATLSAEQSARIKQDYVKELARKYSDSASSTDDIEIEAYFGTYHDAVALFISGDETFASVVLEATIAGRRFIFKSAQPLYIYKDGDFTPLATAYQDGLITEEDVINIWYYYTR